jgi:hypothetical protein
MRLKNKENHDERNMCMRKAVAGAHEGDHDEKSASTARPKRMTANEPSLYYDASTLHLCSRELYDSANILEEDAQFARLNHVSEEYA